MEVDTMNKKLMFSIITVFCVIIAAYSVNAFAHASSGAASSTVTGKFKSLSADKANITVITDQGDRTLPLAASVWVSRSEQKAQLTDIKQGDTVELILNSKNQAAYVKAFIPDVQLALDDKNNVLAAPSPAPASPTSAAMPANPANTVSPSPDKALGQTLEANVEKDDDANEPQQDANDEQDEQDEHDHKDVMIEKHGNQSNHSNKKQGNEEN
jgi:Cu/Ag efflux protein CusF